MMVARIVFRTCHVYKLALKRALADPCIKLSRRTWGAHSYNVWPIFVFYSDPQSPSPDASTRTRPQGTTRGHTCSHCKTPCVSLCTHINMEMFCLPLLGKSLRHTSVHERTTTGSSKSPIRRGPSTLCTKNAPLGRTTSWRELRGDQQGRLRCNAYKLCGHIYSCCGSWATNAKSQVACLGHMAIDLDFQMHF